VSPRSSWNIFSGPGGPPRTSAEHFIASPFTRLARVHALQVAGDALIALALANSLFFSIPTDEARGKVALYLILTMAPFAVVAPLIGPALDRAANGRRMMVVVMSIARLLVGLLMIGHLDSLLLFPEAFLMLVLSKGYMVAKSAIVPTTVSSDQELIEANSKLSIITGFSGFVAGIPGLILGAIGGPEWIVGMAIVVFGLSAVIALKLPATAAAPEPPSAAEENELRGRGIILAASATGLLRGIVGFLLFLLAFDLRDEPTWQLGAAIVASLFGSFAGSLVAPFVRRTTQEEDILIGSLLIATVTGLLAAWKGGLPSAMLLTFAVGFSANTGKLAFDSIVQRDAADANRGRAFARFETRFQIFWVIGAFLPVIIPIPEQVGFLIIALTAAFAGVTYWAGRRNASARRRRPRPAPPEDVADPDPTLADATSPGVSDATDAYTTGTMPFGASDTEPFDVSDDVTGVTPPPPGPARSRRPAATSGQRPPPGASRRRRPRPTPKPRRRPG
jgi:Major Facilitator Superfamily